MYKIIGKISNFNPKASYAHLGLNTVVAQAKPVIATIAVKAAKEAKHPAVLLNKKLLKKAKHEFKVNTPDGYKPKRIN